MSRQVRHIERLALDAHALAFPSRVKAAIAKIGNIGEAADGLAQADVVATYAKRIKATTEEVNSVQYGKLLLAALVGELCPAMSRKQTGRGEKLSDGTGQLFCADTLTTYRKLSRHQTDGQIDDYWEAVTDGDHDAEMSIAGRGEADGEITTAGYLAFCKKRRTRKSNSACSKSTTEADAEELEGVHDGPC